MPAVFHGAVKRAEMGTRGNSENAIPASNVPHIIHTNIVITRGLALVRRRGLKNGRRTIAMIGLSASALFTVATLLTPNKYVALVFLALSYAGSDFMLPTSWAVCLDIGKKYAGAVTGAMNTAGQIGSFLSSVVFGYLVKYSGSYEVPLVPMAVMLTVSAALWMKIDATKALIPEGVDAKKLAA